MSKIPAAGIKDEIEETNHTFLGFKRLLCNRKC